MNAIGPARSRYGFRPATAAGCWLLQGHNTSPDIEVENLPHATWNGSDAQLDAAIANVTQRLRDAPVTQPPGQPITARVYQRALGNMARVARRGRLRGRSGASGERGCASLWRGEAPHATLLRIDGCTAFE